MRLSIILKCIRLPHCNRIFRSRVIDRYVIAVNMSSKCSPSNANFPKAFTEEELKKRLTPEQFSVTQKAGTERAFTGKYCDNHAKGIYKCVVCEENLFDSETKFESGSGWPSFYDVLEKGKVKLIEDKSLFMTRTEVLCAQCGSHLGHAFNDGPAPTGQRYCMNSASLDFEGGNNNNKIDADDK